MCLAAAGRILEITGDGLQRSALVDLAGHARPISLAMVPDAGLGDWVKVHSGYAFEVMTSEDAAELLDLTDAIGRHL